MFLVLGLTLTSASLTHLHSSKHLVHRAQAESAAEAALAEACERIVAQPDFGTTRVDAETIETSFGPASGFLTFNRGKATDREIPFSTSNRFGLEPETGWESLAVPPYSVQLFSMGESGGVKVVLEAVLSAPEFPYVVASSGPIESEGALLVGTTSSLQEVQQADKLRPSAISSNGRVDISGTARVKGSVESAEQISVAPSVSIEGELRPYSQPHEFQDIDVASLRPAASLPLQNTINPKLTGRYHHNGPSIRIVGGLELDDAVLFVNGDASIQGGVTGKGAIVVNGSLTVEGSSSLAATTQLALVAQDNLTVTGRAKDSSFFQGLIYTEGDFFAEDVTLVGAFLANKPKSATEPGSQIQLKNVNLVQLPEYGTFDLDAVVFMLWGDGNRESQGGRESLTLIEVDLKDIPALKAASTVTREGGSVNEGNPQYVKSVDFTAMAAVSRGRVATVQDGKVVSEWSSLDQTAVQTVLESTEPPKTTLGPADGPGGIPDAIPALMGFEAAPDSPFWQIVQASFHFDLNEFLGAHDRVRLTSWRVVP